MDNTSDPKRREPNFTSLSEREQFSEAQDKALRNERRDERMHVRVHLPFDVNLGGKRYSGHDISVSGFSTALRPPLESGETAQCEIDILCNGFRATIPVTGRMLGTRADNRGGRFEIAEIGKSEASILRRLIRSHLSGVHLTIEQLSAREDPQTVRDRVARVVQPPRPTPNFLRIGGAVAIMAALYAILGAALYEHLFVIEPDFAAVTAPEIRIHAPVDGVLAPHNLNPSDGVKRDQLLAEVHDPEINAQITLAEATLNYTDRLLKNLRESLSNDDGGKATVISAAPDANGAPVFTKLTPLERRAQLKELESNHGFAKAKLEALRARSVAGTIYAPCDCTVYSIRSGAGGYWVQKGALIARLISNNPEHVTVEALVHLNTIRGIEPNGRAEVVMPTTGEKRRARVKSVQLEGQKIERAGFPEWARQDMSHGTVVLAMEQTLPSSLVGHPVQVRFIDTDSAVGEIAAAVFGTLSKFMHRVADQVSAAGA